MLRKLSSHLAQIEEVVRIINADSLSDTEKVQSIKSLLESQDERKLIEEQVHAIEREANRVIKDEDFYEILGGKSLKLQN